MLDLPPPGTALSTRTPGSLAMLPAGKNCDGAAGSPGTAEPGLVAPKPGGTMLCGPLARAGAGRADADESASGTGPLGRTPSGACNTLACCAAAAPQESEIEAISANPAAARHRPSGLTRKLIIGENLLHTLDPGCHRLVQIKKPTRKHRHENDGGNEEAGSPAHDFSFFWTCMGPFGFMPPGQSFQT